MKTLKKIGIAIVVIAVLAVAAFLILRKSEKPQMKYKTAEIHRGSIVNTVTATGTIEPIVQVEVGTQVSGIINHIYVDYNSVVKKGEVIAELDKTTLEADLASSSATLQSNKTEYEYQEKNFLRIKGLHTNTIKRKAVMKNRSRILPRRGRIWSMRRSIRRSTAW